MQTFVLLGMAEEDLACPITVANNHQNENIVVTITLKRGGALHEAKAACDDATLRKLPLDHSAYSFLGMHLEPSFVALTQALTKPFRVKPAA